MIGAAGDTKAYIDRFDHRRVLLFLTSTSANLGVSLQQTVAKSRVRGEPTTCSNGYRFSLSLRPTWSMPGPHSASPIPA